MADDEEKKGWSTGKNRGIIVTVIVVILIAVSFWYLTASFMPVRAESSHIERDWNLIYGNYGDLHITFRNAAAFTEAKNVTAYVIVEDQSGETEAVENIELGNIAPGATVEKTVFVDYESEDTELNVEIEITWSTWFWGQRTRWDSFHYR